MKEVSVVVPVYNVEAYIEQCIRSIINQSINIEIIAVDDGSTDSSGKILDYLSSEYKNLKVIHTSNNGVVKARTIGIQAAEGKYIGFVDGDDFVKENSFSVLHSYAEQYDCDIVLNQAFFHSYNGYITSEEGIEILGLYEINRNLNVLFEKIYDKSTRREILPFMWAHLYKTDLVRKIHYNMPQDIKFMEDQMFVWSMLTLISRVYVINEPLYFYRRRYGSACNSENRRFLYDMADIYDYISKIYNGFKYEAIALPQMKSKLAYNIILSLGMLDDSVNEFHLFPYEKIEKGSKIILYGAGKVGCSYYRQCIINHYAEIVLWTDTNYTTKHISQVESPQKINNIEFDYLIIAVWDALAAADIKKYLTDELNVEPEKIVMHVPVPIVNFLSF